MAMERPLARTQETSSATSMTSARALLATIVATGAMALATIFAIAPRAETVLLIGALALPWTAAALALGIVYFNPAALIQPRPARLSPTAPANQSKHLGRLAGATIAIAALLLVGLIAQQLTGSPMSL